MKSKIENLLVLRTKSKGGLAFLLDENIFSDLLAEAQANPYIFIFGFKLKVVEVGTKTPLIRLAQQTKNNFPMQQITLMVGDYLVLNEKGLLKVYAPSHIERNYDILKIGETYGVKQ